MERFKKVGLALSLSVLFFGTAKADPLLDCFNSIKAQDYKKALQYGLEAIKLFSDNPVAYFCTGAAYSDLGKYNLAIKYLKIAERHATQKQLLEHIYNFEGTLYTRMGDYKNALLYDNRTLKLAIKLGDRKGEAFDLNNIGMIYRNIGKLDNALEFYEKALKVSDEKDKTTIYNNIASIYALKGDYNKAIEYLQKAIKINQRYGNYFGLGENYINIGYLYIKTNNLSKAKEYLNKGLEMEEKIGNKRWIGVAYSYLGELYKAEGDKTLAKEYLIKGAKLLMSIGDKPEAAWAISKLKELDKK